MNRLLAVAILCLASVSANAAGSYALTVVNTYNPFTGAGTFVLSGPLATGGTATVDALDSVSTSGVQWSIINGNATYNYSNGDWTGVVGGTSVGKTTETCVQTAGMACTSVVSGLLGIWATGVQNGGGPSSGCAANAFFGAGLCDRVSIQEVAGVSLTIIEQSEFASIPGLAAGYIFQFTAIPVPAAVWLFGSALGLMGVMRRKISS